MLAKIHNKIIQRLMNGKLYLHLAFGILVCLLLSIFIYLYPASSESWITAYPEKPPERKQLISGILRPQVATDYLSPAPGVIKSISKNVGSFVRKGELILEIDSPDTVSQLIESEVALLKAKDEERFNSSGGQLIEISNARKKYKEQMEEVARSKKRLDESLELFNSGIISRNEFESAETQYKNAQASSEIASIEFNAHSQKNPEHIRISSKLNLRMAEIKFNRSQSIRHGLKIYSNHDGIIYPARKGNNQQKSNEILEVGRRLNQHDPLFVLVKNDQLKFQAEVSRDSVAGLKVGDAIDLLSVQKSSQPGVQSGLTRLKIDSIGYKIADADKKDESINPLMIIEGGLTDSIGFYPYMRVMAYLYFNSPMGLDNLKFFNLPQNYIDWRDGVAYVEVKSDLQEAIKSKALILSLDKSTAWIGVGSVPGTVFQFKRPGD